MDDRYEATAGRNERAPAEHSPLAQIEARILQAARAAQEIGNKLNGHADLVHGSVPDESGKTAVARDRPTRPCSTAFSTRSTKWTVRSPTWRKPPAGIRRWPSAGTKFAAVGYTERSENNSRP